MAVVVQVRGARCTSFGGAIVAVAQVGHTLIVLEVEAYVARGAMMVLAGEACGQAAPCEPTPLCTSAASKRVGRSLE